MKKVLPPELHFLISFIAFYLSTAQLSFGQDCKTQAAARASVFVRGMDVVVSTSGKMNAAELAKMKPQLGKAENWIKSRLADFTGAKLLYSNEFYPDYQARGSFSEIFYNATGIKNSSSARMRFFAYYCYDNSNTIHTEAESGSFVSVIFNNVFISGLCTDAGLFTINGKPAFKIFEKDRTEGKIDFYEQRAKSNVYDTVYTSKNNFIIIRNSDRPVFIAVTRKEYLEQMLKDVEVYRVKQKDLLTEIYKSQLVQLENEIKVKKEYDKKYTADKEALERKKFTEMNNPGKLDSEKQKIDEGIKTAIEMIRQYLEKPNEWLSRSFKYFYPYSFESYSRAAVKKYFDEQDSVGESPEDATGTEIVSINPAYFNKDLGSDVPQLIMAHLSKKAYAHMLKVTRLIIQPGAFSSLEAMLNRSN